MHFTKMQGLGNDYLYVYGEVPNNVKELTAKLSERHFGAGSDGMIYISPSSIADFKMRIFNADGSEAKMCGNGIRCVGKYVYDKGYTNKKYLKIETLSGIKNLGLDVADGKVKNVSVAMGKAEVFDHISIKVDNVSINCIPVLVGNSHAVVFVKETDFLMPERIAFELKNHKRFPDGVNVECVKVISETVLRMKVWERGSGITMACGTGACATVVAAAVSGICPFDRVITVVLDGGELKIKVDSDYSVTMTGPAEFVYEGETDIC